MRGGSGGRAAATAPIHRGKVLFLPNEPIRITLVINALCTGMGMMLVVVVVGTSYQSWMLRGGMLKCGRESRPAASRARGTSRSGW